MRRPSDDNMAAVTTSLVTCLVYVITQLHHVTAATTVAPANNAPAANATSAPAPGEFAIVVAHEESDTSEISITWTVNHGSGGHVVESFLVESRKVDGGKDTIVSPSLNSTMRGYVVQDLRTNTHYEVCLIASVVNDTDVVTTTSTCDTFKTLATLRADSIYVLLLVVGYLLLMVIIGIICWKCKLRELEKREDGDDDETEKINPQNSTPNYAANNRPHSPIEDPDIPYITPPFEQLTPEEQKQFQQVL